MLWKDRNSSDTECQALHFFVAHGEAAWFLIWRMTYLIVIWNQGYGKCPLPRSQGFKREPWNEDSVSSIPWNLCFVYIYFFVYFRLKFKSYKHLAEEEVEFDPQQEKYTKKILMWL